MKRLLLISYVFPPEPSPGALRPGYLARYLQQYGWDVTVLTHSMQTPPFEARVVPVPSLGGETLERLPFRLRDRFLVPDVILPWMPRAVAAGHTLLRGQSFHAILSTALPASVHLVGAALAKRSGVPWIADYRDPWSGNVYARRGPVRRAFERALERRLLTRAAAVTTISEPIAAQLHAVHGRRAIDVVPNAYDPVEWNAIPHAQPSRFDLCYTGSMYDGKRSPDLLFEAISQLRKECDAAGNAARVHFFGPNSEGVAGGAARFGLTLAVRQHGVVPREAAMQAQRTSAALLLFLNMDERTASEMGSKYLEYVGAGRPIIAFGPRESVMREFIRRNRLGWFASDVDEAKNALRAAHARFAEQQFDVRPAPGAVPTARELAGRFATILEKASTARPARSIA
ncbi:MAG TPA: glycosyltransferase [Candidatus Baltobacteraceae bacterium]|nr:glycosyltransferase [Candidatus Baltobacteraceae bacterium]